MLVYVSIYCVNTEMFVKGINVFYFLIFTDHMFIGLPHEKHIEPLIFLLATTFTLEINSRYVIRDNIQNANVKTISYF